MFMTRRFLSVVRVLAAAAVVAVLSGCDEDVVFKPEYSINLLQPGPKWPNQKKLSASHKEVLEKYGRPDHLRIQWNPEGRIGIRSEMQNAPNAKDRKTLPPLSWVYAQKNLEVVFSASGEAQERALTDEVRLVMKHGDPEDVKRLPGDITQWTFYGNGRIYKMSHGRIVEEKEFPAMGRYLK